MAASRSAATTAVPDLLPALMPSARLHVVTGKGGTGKTTVAAALALALASTGRKVLLIEVEGRQSIAQLFDVPALPYAEHRLTTTGNGGSLWGLAIDAELAMIEYLDMFYGLKRSARGLKKMGAVDFVTTLAPGLRDVLLTGKVKEAVTRTNPDGHLAYDAVVLDGPPTGRIGKFLDATREVASLTKFGPINRQSAGVIELLHSPRTVVHLVTLLEEMPVQETIDAATELAAAEFTLGAVVVNRARPDLIAPGLLGDGGAPNVKTLATGLRKANVAPTHAAALAAEMTSYAGRQQLQLENAERLDAIELPRIELPDLNPPVELGELTELAACFTVGLA
ncbi:MAG: ArsA-related P-loop ATPase [Jatrophihabitantaceae bacterium]